MRLAWVCNWCYLARFAAAKLAGAELNGGTTTKDSGGGEDGDGKETVEFYCAAWGIPSLYPG